MTSSRDPRFDLGKAFLQKSLDETKAQKERSVRAAKIREASRQTLGENCNNGQEQNNNESRTRPRTAGNPNPNSISSPSSIARGTLRDILIFSSKQIYIRGFEALNLCYFDFAFDLDAVETFIQLFKDVDVDRDGRLGVSDIIFWVKSQGGKIDSDEAQKMIKDVHPSGGFLSKLDFVRLMLDREMALEASGETSVKTEDLLWASFVAMDANKDGWITCEDIKRLLRPLDFTPNKYEAKQMNNSGFWTFDDYKFFIQTGIMPKAKESHCVLL